MIEAPSAPPDASNDALIGFLGIGVIINLVLVIAFFIWARKQWKKTDRGGD